jgi:hypothetical protein
MLKRYLCLLLLLPVLTSCLPEAEPGVEVNTNNPNLRAVMGENHKTHCYASADLKTEVSCAPVPIKDGVPMEQRQQQLQPNKPPQKPIAKW